MESIEALKLAEHVRVTKRKAECAERLAQLAEVYQKCVLAAPKERAEPSVEALEEQCRARLKVCAEPGPPVDGHAVKGLPCLQDSMRERCQRVQRPVTVQEVQQALDQSFVKRVAGAADVGPALMREYADLLSFAVRNVGTWDWPAVSHRLDYFPWQGRCRQVVELDVVTALFLSILGDRWQRELKGALLEQKHAKTKGKQPPSELESWTLSVQRGPLFLAALGEEYGAAPPQDRVEWIPNVIAVRRKADRDLQVVQGDVSNLSNTLSHALVQRVAERLGLPQCWRDFLRAFCRYPLEQGGRAQRGVPGFQALSILLGELCLHVVDQLAFRQAEVWPLRFHDDYYFVAGSGNGAKAHAAWAAALQRVGLAPNTEKQGSWPPSEASSEDEAVVVPDGPEGPVRWNLLRLGPDGWQVDAKAVSQRARLLDAALKAAPTTMDKVWVHNAHTKALDDGLGKPTAALGEKHAAQTVECMKAQLERVGLAAQLATETGGPSDWVRWPSGWGGLGLRGCEQRAADARLVEGFTLPEKPEPELPAPTPPVPQALRQGANAAFAQMTQYMHQLQHAEQAHRSEQLAAARHARLLREQCDRAVRPVACAGAVQLDVPRPRCWADVGERLCEHFGTTTLVPSELVPRLVCKRFGCA